jgi:hypothetical protein
MLLVCYLQRDNFHLAVLSPGLVGDALQFLSGVGINPFFSALAANRGRDIAHDHDAKANVNAVSRLARSLTSTAKGTATVHWGLFQRDLLVL